MLEAQRLRSPPSLRSGYLERAICGEATHQQLRLQQQLPRGLLGAGDMLNEQQRDRIYCKHTMFF